MYILNRMLHRCCDKLIAEEKQWMFLLADWWDFSEFPDSFVANNIHATNRQASINANKLTWQKCCLRPFLRLYHDLLKSTLYLVPTAISHFPSQSWTLYYPWILLLLKIQGQSLQTCISLRNNSKMRNKNTIHSMFILRDFSSRNVYSH